MHGTTGTRHPSGSEWAGSAQDIVPLHNDLLLALDMLAGVALGYFCATFYVRFTNGDTAILAQSGPLWRELMLGSLVAALVVRNTRGIIERTYLVPHRFAEELLQRSAFAAALLMSIGLLTRRLDDDSRAWVIGWSLLFAIYIGLSRLFVVRYWLRLAERGRLRESVAVIGPTELAERLSADADIVTLINDPEDWSDPHEELEACELLQELLQMARAGELDTIIVALDHDLIDVESLMRHLKIIPVQVTVCPNLGSEAPYVRGLRVLGGVPLAVVSDRPVKRWGRLFKAILDIFGACVLLILMAPFLAAALIAVACESPGPVIYRQVRSGWAGRQFTIYKIRTMWHAPGTQPGRQTERNDARCTRVGAFLRRTSLDELPQLWNVLKGDMSLVGPRPHAEALHSRERAGCAVVAEYAQRNRVKPGITGWAQVHGLRGAIESSEQLRTRIEFDLYYIDHWSIWLDLAILARTPGAILFAENAF